MSLVAEENDCQSSKYEFDNERNERSFDHVRQFLSIIEECDKHARGTLRGVIPVVYIRLIGRKFYSQ
jgi:hypothetical protein